MAGVGIKVFDSLNDVINIFGVPYLGRDQLTENGLRHILIRDNGYLRFSLVISKRSMFDLVNKNFSGLVDEKIEGFKGVYGYLGVNPDLLNSIKSTKGLNEKMFVVTVEYEGPFYTVNSGAYTGMVIVTENVQNINFKTITS